MDTGPAKDITTTYTNSAHGLILQRQSVQAGVKVGTHHYYYADGRRVGDVGDDPAENSRVSYAEALARKGQAPQDRNNLYKNFKPVTAADFDQNYEPINPGYPAPTGSSYTARGGETLRNVAHALWGDQALWYLIAEVNGLDGSQPLQQGQVLVIPNKVTNIHNNSQTVRPYNPGEAIGHIDPTLPPPPPPPQSGGCGALGMIIVIAVAVVVTAATSGAAAAALNTAFGTTGGLGAAAATAAGYAAGAALGSIASQGVAMAIGLQDKFDWRSVGQAALGGAASGAVTALTAAGGGLASLAGDGWEAVGRAALSSAGTQVLRGHWDWREVVASAVSTGVGGDAQAGGTLGATLMATGARFAGNWLSSRITTGEANPRGAWAQTVGQMAGDFISTEAQLREYGMQQGRQLGQQARQWWDGETAYGGTGLRVDPATARLWEPQRSFETPVRPLDYSLGGEGVRLDASRAESAAVSISGAPAFGQLGSGTYAPVSRDIMLSALQGPDGPAGAYPNTQGDWIGTRPGTTRPFGEIRPSRFALDDLPTELQSAYGPAMAAYDHMGQGFMTLPVDEGGSRKIFSPPAGYQVPSLATLQAQQWARGVADGFTQAPAGLWGGIKDVGLLLVDGPRLLFDNHATPYSGITRGVMDGRITWSSAGNALMVGLLENSPAGILTNMAWGTPETLYSAGTAIGGGAFGAGLTGVTASGLRWAQKLGDYSLDFGSLPSSGSASYARGQRGAVVTVTVRNLRAEVTSVLPEGFELVRLGRGGAAILRYGDDTFYSVPKNQYSLIPELRSMDTMGDVFTQRVQAIADGFDARLHLSDAQNIRLGLTPEGWLKNKFMSSYKGSYVHDGFRQQLPLIDGGDAYSYKTVGPDVVQVGGSGNGLKYEITQITPSLNAIYSHTRKYSNELLRYVTYR